MDWLNILIQGALLGGLYALFAIGLSLSFGIMRLVNIAHGDLIVLSAYIALVTINATGLSAIASLVVVVPAMFVLGYVLQRGLLNLTLSGGLLPPLLVTFGISVIIENVLLELFGADIQRLHAGTIETASLAARRHRGRGLSAARVRHRGGRHRRAAAPVLSHGARPRLPRHLGRRRHGGTDGHRQPAPLRRGAWRSP